MATEGDGNNHYDKRLLAVQDESDEEVDYHVKEHLAHEDEEVDYHVIVKEHLAHKGA